MSGRKYRWVCSMTSGTSSSILKLIIHEVSRLVAVHMTSCWLANQQAPNLSAKTTEHQRKRHYTTVNNSFCHYSKRPSQKRLKIEVLSPVLPTKTYKITVATNTLCVPHGTPYRQESVKCKLATTKSEFLFIQANFIVRLCLQCVL